MSDLHHTSSSRKDGLLGVSVGAYRIESILGEDAIGLVYRARHELLDRSCAIKVLRPEVAGDASLVKNFLAEAQTLSALRHPNIIDIVGFGVLPDGRQYMVMEHLQGVTLEHELACGRLPLDRVLSIAEHTLSGLSAAHAVGVIHGGLKLSAVFLARGSGDVEVVKLLDFGLAAQELALVAPGQVRGASPDTSSDLYFFGVMLFEMLTGRSPFDAHADAGGPMPHGLTVLLRELMDSSPAARPASVEAVRERLSGVRALLKAPVRLIQLVRRATPVPVPRQARRRLGAPAAASLALLAVCVPLFVVLGSSFGSAAPPRLVPLEDPVPTLMVAATGESPVEVEAEATRTGERLSAATGERPVEAALTRTGELLSAATGERPVEAALTRTGEPLSAATGERPVEAEATRTVVPLPAAEAAAEAPTSVVPSSAAVVEVEPEAVVRRAKPSRSSPAPHVSTLSGCQPDERWRAAARANLQELQQLAAGHPARWTDFERLEPGLSAQINTALTGAQCDAAQSQIRKLAAAWRE